jgi:hypothetical protein
MRLRHADCKYIRQSLDGEPRASGGPQNNCSDRPLATHELPPTVHRDLVTYAEVLARQSRQPSSDPLKLIAPMLARFMATDRAFAKDRRARSLTRSGDG